MKMDVTDHNIEPLSLPVSAMTAPRAPDALKKNLPMPALSTSSVRRLSKRDLVGTAFPIGIIAGSGIGFVVGGAVGAVVGFLIAVFGIGVVIRRGARGFAEAHGVAYAQLEAGAFDTAVASFEALAASSSLHQYRLPVLFNLGVAEARRGQLEAALSLWSTVWQSTSLASQPQVKTNLPLLMADAYARVGDVFAARAWLGAIGASPPAARPFTACVEALILLREGRFDDAEGVYAGAWSSLENALQGVQLRDARVLRAFGAKARGAADDVLLAPLRPGSAGRFAHLATGWPALASFIVDHKL